MDDIYDWDELSDEEEALAISLLSEEALAEDWLSQEDEEAWKDL